MFSWLHRHHHKKFRNPYPPLPNPSPVYRLKEQIFSNTEKLLPLVYKSSHPRRMRAIIFQLNRTHYANLMLMKNEIFYLPVILNKAEKIQMASSGNLNGRNELLVFTNQRLIFVHYDVIKKRCHHLSVTLAQIHRAVYHYSVVATNTLIIGRGATQLNIRGVENAKRFAQKINQYLAKR